MQQQKKSVFFFNNQYCNREILLKAFSLKLGVRCPLTPTFFSTMFSND